MQPVLFYGVPQGCSFGSIVALEWLGAPYHLCRIEMPRDMQSDIYARINPVRETPVLLLESGEPLSESAAILGHIAFRGIDRKLGFPQGTPEHDRLNRMVAFLNTTFFSAFSPLWTAYEMEEDRPVQEMLRELGRRQVAKAHAHLDTLLGNREWLVGESPTVADAYFIGIARWADYHEAIDRRDYPNLDRHVRKLETDPAVIFAREIEAGQQPSGAGGFQGRLPLDALTPRLAA